MTKRFLLITGPMRSGTTLLGELLYSRAYSEMRHPGISFDNDQGTTVRNALGLGRVGMRPPSSLDIEEEIQRLAPVPSAQVIGAKVTHVTTGLLALRRRFPQLVVFVCSRSPLDIYMSHRVRTGATAAKALQICAAIMKFEDMIVRERNNKNVVNFDYERVVADPGLAVKQMLHALNLEENEYNWSSLIHGRIASNSSYLPTRGRDFVRDYGVVRSKPVESNLSDLEIALVESLTEPAYTRLGLEMLTDRSLRDQLRALVSCNNAMPL